MPHAKPDELPSGGGGRWPAAGDNFRSVQWGDMEVGYTSSGPLDCTELYKVGGLPGGVCPLPALRLHLRRLDPRDLPQHRWAARRGRRGRGVFLSGRSCPDLSRADHGTGAQSGVRASTMHGRHDACRSAPSQINSRNRAKTCPVDGSAECELDTVDRHSCSRKNRVLSRARRARSGAEIWDAVQLHDTGRRRKS